MVPSQTSDNFKILSVFGTRPEIVKFAPVIQALENQPLVQTINVCTSQHTDLAAPFLELFKLRVDHDLNVMRAGQPLNLLLSRILASVDEVLEQERPDFLLVQGDTTSAMAGAIAAFHRHIPVGHIEAGLRSGDVLSPFPEEMNRVLIDQIASLYFASTKRNHQTLVDAGVAEAKIVITGNPVIDALLQVLETSKRNPSDSLTNLLDQVKGTKPIVLTAHRRENFGGRMQGYFKVLREFLAKHEDVSLVFPVHPNPNVQKLTEQSFAGVDRVLLIEPLPYNDFIHLLSEAWVIVSDSGGVQEEAPTLKKPLLIIRDNTERPESVECGVARLIGEQPEALASHLDEVYHDDTWYRNVEKVANPFGDGNSGQQITKAILNFLNEAPAPSTT